MLNIDLQPIPNQSFSVILDGSVYDITIKETNGTMSYDMTRDNVPVLNGQRIVTGSVLIPYRYLQKGNFVLTTLNEELPDYTKFGSSQFLVYITADEVEALLAGA